MINKELCSIIIPAYNRASILPDTLLSTLYQSYRPLEVIVVDNGSTDNTSSVVREFQERCAAKSIEMHYLYQEQKGASSARNLGLKKAKGSFIQFLDSDDIIAPSKISNQIEALKKIERKNTVAFGDFRRFVDLGEQWKMFGWSKLPKEDSLIEDWLSGLFVACHSILWTRECIDLCGIWDEDLSINDDGEYLIRFLCRGGQMKYVENSFSFYRLHQQPRLSSMNSKKSIRAAFYALEKIRKHIEDLGLTHSHRYSLAKAYYECAEDAVLVDRENYKKCLDIVHLLDPNFHFYGDGLKYYLRKYLGLFCTKMICNFGKKFLRYNFGPYQIISSKEQAFFFQ